MRNSFVSSAAFGLVVFGFLSVAHSQTITGGNLAFKSLGSGGSILNSDGYVGTYVVIPTGGATINFNVNATGAGSAAHMNIGIANSLYSFNISGSSATNYTTQNLTLPAGEYFVRAERDYNNGTNDQFTVNNLSVNTVSGSAASFSNNNISSAAARTDALTAASTYINNFRKGNLNLSVLGAAPGTQIQVAESNSAFKWGTAVPDNLSTYLNNSTYTTRLKNDFNSVTPENAGKWSESDTASGLQNLDSLFHFAQQNNIRVRQHNLVWATQQPTRINTDFDTSHARSSTAATAITWKNTINSEIDTRISNYVGGVNSIDGANRATQFAEMDVYNESYNTGANASSSTNDNYWKVMAALPAYGGNGTDGSGSGAAFAADLYHRVQLAVNTAGANTKLFTNDYNILNNSSDQYGKNYVQHIESIRTAGAGNSTVTGIGTEWYNTPGVGTNGSQVDPARAYATWQNLAGQGLPLEVTEFGETTVAGSDQAIGLTTAMTLAFGTPQMTGFTLWGFQGYSGQYTGATGSVLYDANGNITAAGTAYEALHNSYLTNVSGTINADGTVSLPNGAFFGDYKASIGTGPNAQVVTFTYDGTTNTYQIVVPAVLGDFNRDGHFTAADILAMQNALADLPTYETAQGMNDAYLDSIGDFNGDNVINAADLQMMLSQLASGHGSESVPEPASLALLALGGMALCGLKLRRRA